MLSAIPGDAALVAFDLDDTLAPSKSPLPPRMGGLLARLIERVPVGVISGGNFEQFESQLVAGLEASASAQQAVTSFGRLHLLPTCGTQYYRWVDGEWVREYSEDLSDPERSAALAALETEARRLGLWEAETWGPILEDRGTQVTFSALGQAAPVEAKKRWDPTGTRKNALAAAVQALLPDLEVRSGGSTSVDITRRGIDKAYGMRRLAERTGIDLADMAFVGDRLDESGNDRPVLDLGVHCLAVGGWEATADAVEAFLALSRGA